MPILKPRCCDLQDRGFSKSKNYKSTLHTYLSTNDDNLYVYRSKHTIWPLGLETC